MVSHLEDNSTLGSLGLLSSLPSLQFFPPANHVPTLLKALPSLLSPFSEPKAQWDDPHGFGTQALTSHPLLHFALAKTCLHSLLNIPGPQAALHCLFSLAEAMLPSEPSQAHPLFQVLFLSHCLIEQLTEHCCPLPTSTCLTALYPMLLHCFSRCL